MNKISQHLKVAIVDDSSPFCLLVKQVLAIDGHETDAYHSAADFLKNISLGFRYDLLLIDINLPGQDGLSLVRRIRDDQLLRAIPILLISGDSRKDTVVQGMAKGAQDYLIKPIDPEQLLDRVRLLLQSGQ